MMEFVNYMQDHIEEYLETLRRAVELESPTYEKEYSDLCSSFFQEQFRELGASIRIFPAENVGDHFLASFQETEEPGVLFIGHYDTVFPSGTIKTMPYRIADGKAYGPGTMDMKGGIVAFLYAVKMLKELGYMPEKKNIKFFCNGDEEPGSFTSRDQIVEEARKNKMALVLEPAPADRNTVKTSRKGRGTYCVTAYGKSAHSGNCPEDGVNAVVELSYHLQTIHEMNDYDRGVTLTPVSIEGGLAGMCRVPEKASFTMDVRFPTPEVTAEVDRKIRELQPVLEGAVVEVTGGVDKPPYEANEVNQALFRKAQELAKEVGLKLEGIGVGGGSDGNYTSGAGVPTLDGLGVSGKWLHNPQEYLIIEDVPYRVALIAKLIMEM